MTAERLVFFTDAVAAIALTLLILPLLETVNAAAEADVSPGRMIEDHLGQFGAFALSFAVIFRFWWAHHRIFRHVELINTGLVLCSVAWTFAIVLLPIPTAIIAAFPPSALAVGFYGGTLVLASGSMSVLAWYVWRHPDLAGDRPKASRSEVYGNLSVALAQLIATLVGAIFASTVNYWAFLLFFLTAPIDRLLRARTQD
jgi:uncharacterized membrane protein